MEPVIIPDEITTPKQKIFYDETPYRLDEKVNYFIESVVERGFKIISISVNANNQEYFTTTIIYGQKDEKMNRYTVTIQHSHYGTWDYYGQPEEYLIDNEEKSTIQILQLILTNLIYYKLKLNDKFYETVKDKALMIKEIYQTIKKENYFEISYWSPVNWSETTIGIEKNQKGGVNDEQIYCNN